MGSRHAVRDEVDLDAVLEGEAGGHEVHAEAAVGVGEEALVVAEADGAVLVVLQVGEGLAHLHQRPHVGGGGGLAGAGDHGVEAEGAGGLGGGGGGEGRRGGRRGSPRGRSGGSCGGPSVFLGGWVRVGPGSTVPARGAQGGAAGLAEV